MNMVCVCRGGGGLTFFSATDCIARKSTNTGKTSFSQGHTGGRGGGGPRNPGFATDINSGGSWGHVGRLPRNSQLSFFSEGTRLVKESWVGYPSSPGRVVSQNFCIP